jgi:integrase
MAGRSGGLTTKTVAATKHPGAPARPIRIGDGGGLYLQVTVNGAKSWLFRFTLAGKAREMGLGTVDLDGKAGGVTLAEARQKAGDARRLLEAGTDPLDARKAAASARDTQAKASAAAAKSRIVTFREAAEALIASREGEWRNAKHRAQWAATLTAYAYPSIGELSVADVTTDAVHEILAKIWSRTPETGTRLRGRIEAVLDFSRVKGWRQGDNPARWRGHLAEVLAKPSRIRRVMHFPALPWREVPAFMAALRERRGRALPALEFAILNASRTGEVRMARWREFDLGQGIWTIPPERMKAGRVHRVPLSERALALLEQMRPQARGPGSLVFPSSAKEEPGPLSDMALSQVIRRMNGDAGGDQPRWRDDMGRAVVPHGFRSTFRDWCGETRPEGREVAEACLAHSIKDRSEAAYARSDLLEKRRPVMQAWGEWCTRKPAQVVPITHRAAAGHSRDGEN